MRRYAAGLLLALAAALRLGLYCSRPSLSIDETMTSLEIGARSFTARLQPLAYAQTAPPLFLWTVKLCTVIGGMNEFTLRVVPLIAGLAVPYLVWRVAQRVVAAPAAMLATAITSCAPTLVHYSVIVKPYMTDAVFALVLADGTLGVLADPDFRRNRVRLALAGLAATLGSIPAPFLLGGVGTAVALGVRPIDKAARLIAVLVIAWGAVYLPLYFALYQPVATSDYMQRFWSGAFLSPTHVAGWQLAGRAIAQSLVDRPIPPLLIVIFVALLGAGSTVFARRAGGAITALFGTALLLILAASMLHRYPLSARVLLLAAPTIALWCAVAFDAIGAWNRPVAGILGGVVVLALAAVNGTHPYRTPALRPAILALARAAAPTDPVYISSGAIPAWAFYTTDWSDPDREYLGRVREWGGESDAPGFHNRASRGRAVSADAGGLVLRRARRYEIYGLAAGIQWREVSGLSGVIPDSGWAAHEAARLRTVGSPVWLLVATAYGGSRAALFAALDSAGGRVDVDSVVGGVERARVRFTPAPPAPR